MDIIFDTNVILDYALNRMPLAEDAAKIVSLAVDDKVRGYVSANSITDIYYIVRKKTNNATAKKIIRRLLVNFRVISVDGKKCLDALNLPMDDFEDALVVICAKSIGLDYILTNDKGFLSETLPVPTITPSDFFAKFEDGD